MQSYQTYFYVDQNDVQPFLSDHIQLQMYTYEYGIPIPLDLAYETTINNSEVIKQNVSGSHQFTTAQIPNVKVKNPYVFDCNICGRKFASRGSFTNHLRCVHKMLTGEKKYRCAFCQESFYSTQELFNHVGKQHDKIGYQCRHCPAKLNNQENYKLHILSEHENGISTQSNVKVNDVFDCNICGMIFVSRGGLTRHMKLIHKIFTIKKKHVCSFCEESFYLPQELVDHVRTQHDRVDYQCRYCPKKLNTQEHYRLHTLSEHKDKLSTHMNGFVPLPQNVLKVTQGRNIDSKNRQCSVLSKRKDAKKDNLREVQVYKCSKCHQIHESFSELKQHHKENHLKAQTTECELCGELIPNKKLQKHIKTIHNTSNNMKCEYCEYETNFRGRLSQHLLRHFKGVDNFHCNYEGCKYRTFFTDEMEKHKKKHFEHG